MSSVNARLVGHIATAVIGDMREGGLCYEGTPSCKTRGLAPPEMETPGFEAFDSRRSQTYYNSMRRGAD